MNYGLNDDEIRYGLDNIFNESVDVDVTKYDPKRYTELAVGALKDATIQIIQKNNHRISEQITKQIEDEIDKLH